MDNNFETIRSDFDIDLGPIGKASGDDGVLVAGGIGTVLLGIGAFLFGKSRAEAKAEEIEAKVLEKLKAEMAKAQQTPTTSAAPNVQVNQVVPPQAAPAPQTTETEKTANEAQQSEVAEQEAPVAEQQPAPAKAEQPKAAPAPQPAPAPAQNQQQPQAVA